MLLVFVLTLLDRPATVLFVVDRPVLSDVTPLCAVLIPVDVDVDSEPTVLFVVDRPVLSDVTSVDS